MTGSYVGEKEEAPATWCELKETHDQHRSQKDRAGRIAYCCETWPGDTIGSIRAVTIDFVVYITNLLPASTGTGRASRRPAPAVANIALNAFILVRPAL